MISELKRSFYIEKDTEQIDHTRGRLRQFMLKVPPSSIHMAGRDPSAGNSVDLAKWTKYTLREVLRRGMGRIKRERLVTQAVREAH